MKLGIVSDCIHFHHPDGRVGTENHIFLKQMQALAAWFDSVVICCPFVNYDEKKIVSFYQPGISFIPVPNAGGNGLADKIRLLRTIPAWRAAFKKVDRQSDIVYQRFPNNLNIPGFFYFHSRHKKVFATYTGTWDNYNHEPVTYRFQKWLLQKYFRGPVWVYSNKNFENEKIRQGYSPSYNESVWTEEAVHSDLRIEKLRQKGIEKLKLITVGAFVPNKNQQLILDACLLLHLEKVPFQLTLVGDGYLKKSYQDFINQNQLQEKIWIAGRKTDDELRFLYRENDFVVQAPIQEGFGKVPMEGFFHGLIPVLSNVNLANAMLGDGERGFMFEGGNIESLYSVLKSVFNRSKDLPEMIEKGRAYAASHTLESWAKEYAAAALSL